MNASEIANEIESYKMDSNVKDDALRLIDFLPTAPHEVLKIGDTVHLKWNFGEGKLLICVVGDASLTIHARSLKTDAAAIEAAIAHTRDCA